MEEEEENKIELTPHQQIAFMGIWNAVKEPFRDGDNIMDRVSLLDGFAGVGKSVIITKLANAVQQTGLEVKITAPTHKALSVMRKLNKNDKVTFSTIHSHLGLKMKNNTDNGSKKLFPDDDQDQSSKKQYGLLIIEEYSFIDSELYTYIMSALQRGTIGHIVFVGDKYQLQSPQDKFSVYKDISEDKIFTLTEVARQAKDNPIIQLSQLCVKSMIENEANDFSLTKQVFDRKINNFMEKIGENNKHVSMVFDEVEFMETFLQEPSGSTILGYTNANVITRNKVIRSFKTGIDQEEFVKGDILILQAQYTVAEIIFNNNQEVKVIVAEKCEPTERVLFNHWILTTSAGKMRVIDGGDKILYETTLKRLGIRAKKETDRTKRSSIWIKFFELKEQFADVKYEYASTIHKSQGSTYPSCWLDLTKMERLSYDTFLRLAYVGITRPSNRLKILY